MERIDTAVGGGWREKLAWMEENPPAGLVKTERERERAEVCPKCSGYVGDLPVGAGADARVCRCDGPLRRCAEILALHDPERRMTFDTLDSRGDRNLGEAMQLARRVATGESRGLAMFGTPGNGKTHTAIAAARLAIGRRTTCGFYNVVELIGRIQETYGRSWHEESRASVIAQVASREIVVLDDLGRERASEDIRSIVYELVNRIYSEGRRLIVCSNLGKDEYRARYDEATTSRIAGMCEVVILTGEDRRRVRRA